METVKKAVVVRGEGVEGWIEKGQRVLRAVKVLYAVMTEHVITPASEPQRKPWTLSDNDVST